MVTTCHTACTYSIEEVQKLAAEHVRCLCTSPNGKAIAYGSDDCNVYVNMIVSPSSLGEPGVLRGHTAPVTSVCMNMKGVCSSSLDKTVRWWRIEPIIQMIDPEPVTFVGHTQAVNAVCATPSGSHLISASDDSSVMIWDTETRQGKRLGHPTRFSCANCKGTIHRESSANARGVFSQSEVASPIRVVCAASVRVTVTISDLSTHLNVLEIDRSLQNLHTQQSIPIPQALYATFEKAVCEIIEEKLRALDPIPQFTLSAVSDCCLCTVEHIVRYFRQQVRSRLTENVFRLEQALKKLAGAAGLCADLKACRTLQQQQTLLDNRLSSFCRCVYDKDAREEQSKAEAATRCQIEGEIKKQLEDLEDTRRSEMDKIEQVSRKKLQELENEVEKRRKEARGQLPKDLSLGEDKVNRVIDITLEVNGITDAISKIRASIEAVAEQKRSNVSKEFARVKAIIRPDVERQREEFLREKWQLAIEVVAENSKQLEKNIRDFIEKNKFFEGVFSHPLENGKGTSFATCCRLELVEGKEAL